MKSEQINELATALCKMQGQLVDTCKDTQAHNYKYSDLSSILTYIRPIMADNGLSVSQLVNGEDSNQIGVETILMHSSGQWVSSNAFMHVQGRNLAQEAGKVITYLRRYSLTAIVGLTQKDEDAAIKEPAKKTTKNETKEKWNPTIDVLWKHFNDNNTSAITEGINELTKEEWDELWALLPNEMQDYIKGIMQ